MKHRDLSLTNWGFEHQKLGQQLGSKQHIIGISHDLTTKVMGIDGWIYEDFTVGLDIPEV